MITEELKKIKQKEMEAIDAPLIEAQKLLAYDEQEDRRIVLGLSNSSSNAQLENLKGKKYELEKIAEAYGEVYTRDQIKQLAVTYNLRFLQSRFYTGNFDIEVAAKMKQFAKETNVELNNGNLQMNFYILAPENMFKLTDKEYITKAQIRAMEKDPIIFYKIDENHFRLIHKWGSDFTIMRYISGFKWKSALNHFFFNLAIILPIVTFLLTLMFPAYTLIHPFLTFLPIIAISAIFSFVLIHTDEGTEIHGYYSHTKWDSTDKIR